MNRGPDGRRLTTEDFEDIAVKHLGKTREELKALRGEKQKAYHSEMKDMTRTTRYNMPELILDTGPDEVSRLVGHTRKGSSLNPDQFGA
jgi:S-adenosylhomocysteine hydrolase